MMVDLYLYQRRSRWPFVRPAVSGTARGKDARARGEGLQGMLRLPSFGRCGQGVKLGGALQELLNRALAEILP